MSAIKKIKGLLLIEKLIAMKNWKTTLTGLLTALPTLLNLFGITSIPADVVQGITALGVFVIGLVAKDHNVTGGTTAQKTISNPPVK